MDKVCTKCLINKDISQFSRRKVMRDGLRSQCKACDKIHNMSYKTIFKIEIQQQRIQYRQSERGKNKNKDYRRIRRAKLACVPYERVEIEYLWKIQRGVCQICFLPIDKTLAYPNLKSLVIDHIIPISRGGPNLAENLGIAHNDCNLKKHDKMYWNLINNKILSLEKFLNEEQKQEFLEWKAKCMN